MELVHCKKTWWKIPIPGPRTAEPYYKGNGTIFWQHCRKNPTMSDVHVEIIRHRMLTVEISLLYSCADIKKFRHRFLTVEIFRRSSCSDVERFRRFFWTSKFYTGISFLSSNYFDPFPYPWRSIQTISVTNVGFIWQSITLPLSTSDLFDTQIQIFRYSSNWFPKPMSKFPPIY